MSGKKGLRRLCGLLALLWLAFIWGRSLQPAAISSQESGAVLNGLTELLRALGLPALLDMTMVRKGAHMAEYALLALLGYGSGIRLEQGLARRLEGLISEFFDITRMDFAVLEREEIQLSILLEQICDEFYPAFTEKGLTCRASIAPRLLTWGDPDKLARVFDNVLRNAVSYSAPGGEVEIWAAEPEHAAILSGGEVGTHIQMGIGDGVIPAILNQKIYSHIEIVTDEEALETARELASKEGLMCGISSGTNVAVAKRMARKLGKGKTVVTILADTAERYFSTPLFER